jgi:hypothetical protein
MVLGCGREMPDQGGNQKDHGSFSSLLSVLEILFVTGLLGYPIYGLIAGQIFIPSNTDGGLATLHGLEARIVASGMLLLFTGWTAIIRGSEANQKTWNLVGYVLMAVGIIVMIASVIFTAPS